MIARMALPRLGGAPAVWNSAMLVYQALLLGGYAYAHWLTRYSARAQAVVHLGLVLIAALLLPIGLAEDSIGGLSPFLWVPWLLMASIGPLFLLVSANAPLLQRWFSLSGGADPYPLFAASNFGSFAGLIAYPLLARAAAAGFRATPAVVGRVRGFVRSARRLLGDARASWARGAEPPRGQCAAWAA